MLSICRAHTRSVQSICWAYAILYVINFFYILLLWFDICWAYAILYVINFFYMCSILHLLLYAVHVHSICQTCTEHMLNICQIIEVICKMTYAEHMLCTCLACALHMHSMYTVRIRLHFYSTSLFSGSWLGMTMAIWCEN